MELVYRNSFFRDLDSLSNRRLNLAIESLIKKISKANSLSSVPRLKLLKYTKEYEYKIELRIQTKIYWILCDEYGERIEFVRIKSEAWCKNNL